MLIQTTRARLRTKPRSKTEYFLIAKTSLVQEIKIKANNSGQLRLCGWADIRPERRWVYN